MARRCFAQSRLCLAWTVVAATFATTAIHAQIHRYDLSFTLSHKNFADTISIEFEDDQVYLPVSIGGQQYRFLLDTGSSQGVVYEGSHLPDLQELGNIVSHDAVGHNDTVRVVGLPPLQLGHTTISGYVANVLRRPPAKRGADGIIGFDLFNKRLLGKIDTRRKQLILTDRKKHFKGETGHEVKYRLKWFVPHFWVSPFMRHVDEVRFDTGSRQLYAMNKQSFDSHAFMSRQVGQQVEGRSIGQLAVGHHGAEQLDTVVFLALDRLKWADFQLLDVHCITTQGGSYIGAPILNYGTVTINPMRKRLTLTPYADADSVTVGNRQFEMAYIPIDNRPTVGLVWEQSDAYRAGFRQGDTIEAIDGQPIGSFRQFMAYRFVKGQTYTYTLRDRNGRKKLVLLLRK